MFDMVPALDAGATIASHVERPLRVLCEPFQLIRHASQHFGRIIAVNYQQSCQDHAASPLVLL